MINILSTLCRLSKVSWSSPNAIKWVLILEIANIVTKLQHWFHIFRRYPFYKILSSLILQWSSLFVPQIALLSQESIQAFWIFLVIIVKKLDHQIFFSVLPMNSLIKLIKCPSWVWILIIIYSVASLLSTSKAKITVYYYGVSIFSEIYYSEVIYGINQSVSPEFFTIARFFTIRKFTIARFHCILKEQCNFYWSLISRWFKS